MAGFYLNRDYIAAHLCVNRFDRIPTCKGSCYLAKKLTDTHNREERLPDLKPNGSILICQAVSAASIAVYSREISIIYPSGDSVYTPLQLSCSVFRPPCRMAA